MKFITQEALSEEKALLVYDSKTPFFKALLSKLKKHVSSIDIGGAVPEKLSSYRYLFIFNPKDAISCIEKVRTHKEGKTLILYTKKGGGFNKTKEYVIKHNLSNIKVIGVRDDIQDEGIIDRALWFLLSNSSEPGLKMSALQSPSPFLGEKIKFPALDKKRTIKIFIALFLILEVFFLLPLLGGFYFLKKSAENLKKGDIGTSRQYLSRAAPLTTLTKNSYKLARPALSFLFVSYFFDNLIDIQQDGNSLLIQTTSSMENFKLILKLVMEPDNSPERSRELKNRIYKFQKQVQDIKELSNDLETSLYYKIEYLQKKVVSPLANINAAITKAEPIINNIDNIIGINGKKQYVLYFLNNMELRPGGGFIGSFALITFKNGSLSNFDIYDSYDADGQLKGHIEPPRAIRQYLEQPHWFLRDSNFNPDFEKNAETGAFFLKKELGIDNLDGSIGITTSAIAYLLEAFGDVYVQDYNKTINAENFYLITQTQVEGDFFPGSITKKTFLSDLTKTLLLSLEKASARIFAENLKKSLDEKHIVINFRDEKIQKSIVSAGWHGKITTPACITKIDNCIIDYIMPVDANLGVNKVNYYIDRSIRVRIKTDGAGIIRHSVETIFSNRSPNISFPGGHYRNFFQLYIPKKARVTKVRINNIPTDKYEIRNTGVYSVVGIITIVPPQKTLAVQINYVIDGKPKKRSGSYQLVIQKQIGSIHNDLSLEIEFPNNFSITSQNFQALAKNNALLYNTSLSHDNIFVVRFEKK